jgi:hypothetical protein
MVYHVIFESNEHIVDRLFGVLTIREGSNGKASVLTLTVLSKKFSEYFALTVPFAMLSRVDAILEYVSLILDPYGSTS